MDNRIFNINGSDFEDFELAFKLAFFQSGWPKSCGWIKNEEKGIILFAYGECEKFICDMNPEELCPIVWRWLQSDEVKKMKLNGWDKYVHIDGSCSKGWRIYVEDWGKVAKHDGVICAITPTWLWHGK